MRVDGWMVNAPGEPMVLTTRDEVVGSGEALIEVAGSGVCHTDLGFYYDGIPTRHPYPLTLGHEVSGRVVAAGIGCEAWEGRGVVVPAVIPCGRCPACATGRGAVCPEQIFPGNDVHGGFASHLKVPVTGLCEVPDLTDAHHNPHDLDLASLSVIADAVTTPYQAIERSGLGNGDLAIFVGAGGVGGFGVQIAATRAASVIAIDVDAGRLELVNEHGADLVLNSAELDFRELRKEIRHFAAEREIPTWRQRIFETSGTSDGNPGRVTLADRKVYDASLKASFRHWVVPDGEPKSYRCLSLVPDRSLRPRSSLGHMIETLFERWDDGGGAWHLRAAERSRADSEGVIDLPLACDWPRRPRQHINFGHGKPAQTHYRRLDTSATQSRLLLTPYTGRSHQLRVHCASLGHPILGCEFYADASTRDASPRLLLHASALQLLHPVSGEALSLHCEPPF